MRPAKESRRVLVIGLDAAEITLVDRWTRDGTLANLARLRERGVFGPLRSTAEWLAGSPWPTFYTGTPPGDHGLYHYLLWRPEIMSTRRPSREWLPVEPFWRTLGEEGVRTVALDVPFAYGPKPFSGVEVSGWATHDLLEPPTAHPPEVMQWARKRFGPSSREEEHHRLMKTRELLALRDRLVSQTDRVGDLAVGLAEREAWDLMLVCFSATHRGGHKLWNLDGVAGEPDRREREALAGALRDVYVACDRALGRILQTGGPDLTVLAFSLHGMGPNTCRSEVLPEILRRILAADTGRISLTMRRRLGARLRAAMPPRLRNELKTCLPAALQDRLTAYWRTGGIDWASTRAFPMTSDLQGYIRVNLRGREAEGIVEPGTGLDDLCALILAGLMSFVDADTGEHLVEEIQRSSALFPAGERDAMLPDLIVRWNPSPASAHREIVSDRFGSVPWPTPGRHPSGRSGNHRPDGFLLAVGEAVPEGAELGEAHILDLLPTLRSLLGLSPLPGLKGRNLFSTKGGA